MSDEEDYSEYFAPILKMGLLFVTGVVFGGLGVGLLGLSVILAIVQDERGSSLGVPILATFSAIAVLYSYYALRWFRGG